MKLAIVSDLHCKHPSKEKEAVKSTFLYSDDIGLNTNKHPVKALCKLIKSEGIVADFLLCPGDITDLADQQGLITGFSHLIKIRDSLDTKYLISTVGNHDASSRDLEADSSFENLKNLDELYPFPDKTNNENYWKSGFTIFKIGNTLFMVFNSCFSHNNSTKAKTSKITANQLSEMSDQLDGLNLDEIKHRVFLCHHHPDKHSNLDYPDDDTIEKGDHLIDLLNKYKFQICIHGHKHDPRLSIRGNLPIFCSGSFSSKTNVDDMKADNTFHIVDLQEGTNKGTIRTWVYLPVRGWVEKADSEFPNNVGFGYNGNIEELGDSVKTLLDQSGAEFINFDELTKTIDDLIFLSEQNQNDLTSFLKNKFNMEFIPSFPSKPKILIKQRV